MNTSLNQRLIEIETACKTLYFTRRQTYISLLGSLSQSRIIIYFHSGLSCHLLNDLVQGRRPRSGRSGHDRTTFLAENGFGRTYIFLLFSSVLRFSGQKPIKKIDNLGVPLSLICLPQGIKP